MLKRGAWLSYNAATPRYALDVVVALAFRFNRAPKSLGKWDRVNIGGGYGESETYTDYISPFWKRLVLVNWLHTGCRAGTARRVLYYELCDNNFGKTASSSSFFVQGFALGVCNTLEAARTDVTGLYGAMTCLTSSSSSTKALTSSCSRLFPPSSHSFSAVSNVIISEGARGVERRGLSSPPYGAAIIGERKRDAKIILLFFHLLLVCCLSDFSFLLKINICQ